MTFDETTRRLTPDAGLWLTQAELQDENARIFSQLMFLGVNDEPSHYTECLDIKKVTWNMDFSKDIDLSDWNPTDKGTTFLQNFKTHIALRLTSNGSGKTLTLSQAVFDTIWNQDGTPKSTDPDSVIYQINKIIKTDKHWSVNRA